jgi:Protein of unknown function (DUF3551)
MNKTIGGFALFLLIGSGTAAEAAPWCAFYGSSTYNCGFYSYEQCLATVRGAGGYCRQNFFEGYGSDRRPNERKPRGDRY